MNILLSGSTTVAISQFEDWLERCGVVVVCIVNTILILLIGRTESDAACEEKMGGAKMEANKPIPTKAETANDWSTIIASKPWSIVRSEY